ncbi:hypothetical protein BDK89_0157 [Ilumatobacter fluminis]|uniref:Uncharacterized protein n=1 Tax=Ilumatobacter fluminis TaxID=467091 RepID=A0A4R7HUK0_9ACTN|nr:hypothetical protein BDK89_0157 [Ilumatobacter fluminis]
MLIGGAGPQDLVLGQELSDAPESSWLRQFDRLGSGSLENVVRQLRD